MMETILTDKTISIELINELLIKKGFKIKSFNSKLGLTLINDIHIAISLTDNNKLLSIFSTYYLLMPYDQFDMLNLLQYINDNNKYLKATIEDEEQDMEIELGFSINIEGGITPSFLLRNLECFIEEFFILKELKL
ncbi:YbjN domain-containing protein [Orbus wheelerorum]|uniref:hypothetical protein n=1 Tax=Orbus wheelerorum TaxID=3074111 RepID=UPI00370DCCA5